MNRLLFCLTLLIAFSRSPAQAQGTFQNLDFEAAQILPGGFPSNSVPGWSAFSGTNQLTTIYYNYALSLPIVGLWGSNSLVISGNFTLDLSQTGSVSQVGFVPADTQSLFFKSVNADPAKLVVSLGGESLLYAPISSGANYTLYGVNISQYAGQTAELKFLAPGLAGAKIDDIEFSSQAIPEPTVFLLILLGSGILLCGRRYSVG